MLWLDTFWSVYSIVVILWREKRYGHSVLAVKDCGHDRV